MKMSPKRKQSFCRGFRTGFFGVLACASLWGCSDSKITESSVHKIPTSSNPAPDPTSVRIAEAFKDVQTQAGVAITKRETARTQVVDLDPRVSGIEDRIQHLWPVFSPQTTNASIASGKPADEKSSPETNKTSVSASSENAAKTGQKVAESTASLEGTEGSRPWEFKALQNQIEHLLTAGENLLVRGNADSYDYAAAADWHIEHARELANRLALPKGFIPDNEFRLVSQEDAKLIRDKCETQLAHFKKAAATRPNGAFAKAAAALETKLALVHEAIEKGPVNLQADFDKSKPGHQPTPKLVEWIDQRVASRDTEIQNRREKLLAKALALDGSDEAVRLKIAQLGKTSIIPESNAFQRHGEWCLERARGFAPKIGSEKVADVAKELLLSRWNDPVKATRLEAALMTHWRELTELSAGSVKDLVFPEAFRASAPDWMVSQLSNGDLIEVNFLLNDALLHNRAIQEAGLDHVYEKGNTYDLKVIEAERDAVQREIKFRQANNGQSRMPAIDLAQLDEPTRDLLIRQASATIDEVLSTDPGMMESWSSNRRYLERVSFANAEAMEQMNKIALDGYRSQVKKYAADAEEYYKLRTKFTTRGLPADQAADFQSLIEKMRRSLVSTEERIREGLRATSETLIAPDQVADLWKQVDAASRKTEKQPQVAEAHSAQKLIVLLVSSEPDGGKPDGWPTPPIDPPPGSPVDPSPGSPKDPTPGKPGGAGGSGATADSSGKSIVVGRPDNENGPASSPLKGSGPKTPLGGLGGGGSAATAEVRRRPTTASPFGDAKLAREQIEFDQAKFGVMELLSGKKETKIAAVREPENPYLMIEDGPKGEVRKATKGERPELKGWLLKQDSKGNPDPKNGTLQPVKFEKIDKLKSIKFLPGGVAFGTVARVEGNWKKGGLIYVGSEQQLYLVRQSGERIKLPKVSPEVLKTCFLLARSKDPVAISIGYTGARANPLVSQVISKVLLHPELRDTQVGLDILEADRLPWMLGEDKLPNGGVNPFVAQMRPLVEQARDLMGEHLPIAQFLKKMGEVASLDEPSSEKGIPKFDDLIHQLLPAGKSRLDFILRAINESDEDAEARFQTFVTLENEQSLKDFRDFLRKDLEQLFRKGSITAEEKEQNLEKINHSDLASLMNEEGYKKYLEEQGLMRSFFDEMIKDRKIALRSLLLEVVANPDRVPWRYIQCAALSIMASPRENKTTLKQVSTEILHLMTTTHLSLLTDSEIHFKEVETEMVPETSLRIRYVYGQIKATDDGLERTDAVSHTKKAGKEATRLIPELEKSFEPLRKAREYATWIALMRWANDDSNLEWVDLADLATVEHRNTHTPDYLLRGSKKDVKDASLAFGLEATAE